MKIYTKTGDKGKTSLIGGTKVYKSDLRIESYGTVDELNSFVGLCLDHLKSHNITNVLAEIQDRLFTIGSALACDPEKEPKMKIPDLHEGDIGLLEKEIDKMNDAIAGMNELLNELPKTEASFKNAQSGLMKNIETERITEDAIITDYLTAQQKGIDHDLRQDNYAQYGDLTLDDVYKFHKETLAGQRYTYCVIASDKRIDPEELKKYGALQTLSVSELFGF